MYCVQALLQGLDPDSVPDPDEEVDRQSLSLDPDLLWSKPLSWRQAGYVMGLGCTVEDVNVPLNRSERRVYRHRMHTDY